MSGKDSISIPQAGIPKAGPADARGMAFTLPVGVNPMVTVEALAYMVAEGLAETFRVRGSNGGAAAAAAAPRMNGRATTVTSPQG